MLVLRWAWWAPAIEKWKRMSLKVKTVPPSLVSALQYWWRG